MKSFRPQSIDEVRNYLVAMTENSSFIGGGTDYIIKLRNTLNPDILCYLGHIKEYKGISETENEIIIGAYTTMTELAENEIVHKYIKAMVDASSDVGSLQIRNNATIGGNLANASPAGDLIPILYLFNAKILTISPEGERKINVSDLIIKSGCTCLKYNEAITKIIIPKPSFISAFAKIGSRTKVTISKINIAIGIVYENNIVKEARVYVGAIAITPLRLERAEQYLVGKPLTEDNILEVANILSDFVHESIPNRTSKYYKAFSSKGAICDVFNIIEERI